MIVYCLFGLGLCWGVTSRAQFTNLVAIDFEPAEGYTNGPLEGCPQWYVSDPNGSGVTNFWPGLGQQAYVGLNPATPPNDFADPAYAVRFTPQSNLDYVSFSTVMAISASDEGGSDEFGWFIINADGNELVGVDFDNQQGTVSYEINHGDYANTIGTIFTNSVLYRLEVDLDFVQDTWTANLGDQPITPFPQPIGEPGDQMQFLAFVVVWYYSDPAAPGDNAMYFDHVRIVAGSSPPTIPPPTLAATLTGQSSNLAVSVSTEPGLNYVLEHSPDLIQWNPAATNFATNLLWTVTNCIPPGIGRQYYRAHAIYP